MGGVLQGKEAAFRLIQEVAGTVADLAAFDPQLNAELVISIAHDGTAIAHCDQLETGLGEVVKMLSDAIRFFDLDIAGLYFKSIQLQRSTLTL
jgi:hypothetical protein